jgi:hypothetical protein
MYLDIDTPDLHGPRGVPSVEQLDDIEDTKQSILDGLTSVDMSKAIGDCLASWYLSVLDKDVEVSTLDALEVRRAKDRRRLLTFMVRQTGGLRQVGAVDD